MAYHGRKRKRPPGLVGARLRALDRGALMAKNNMGYQEFLEWVERVHANLACVDMAYAG
jgi:hypothetical protein